MKDKANSFMTDFNSPSCMVGDWNFKAPHIEEITEEKYFKRVDEKTKEIINSLEKAQKNQVSTAEEALIRIKKINIERYIKIVAIERINTFNQIVIKKKFKNDDEAKEVYKNIDDYICSEIGCSIDELMDIRNDDMVKKEKNKIDELHKKYSTKKSSSKKGEFQFIDFSEFYYWHFDKTKNGNICCYCGVNQDELNKLENNNPMNKLKRITRGKTLEIERIISFPEEKNIYSKENCDYACHVCNNAKSDFISPNEFYLIAKGISEMWKSKNIKCDFNEDNLYWKIEY